MRLTPYEREAIRKVADEVFGNCEVFLFGSRVKRG